MKTKLLLLLLLWAEVVWGQVSIDETNKIILINADTKVMSFETLIKEGEYTLQIINPKDYSISMAKNAVLQPILSTSPVKNIKNDSLISRNTIKFGQNTEYIFKIYATEDPKEKVYKIKSQTDWSWTTTFGANSIFFSNRSKYISRIADDGSQKVAQIQDRKLMEVLPTIMFTFMNNHNNAPFGFTGGLGINFEEIAVFSGLSLGIGQNIILTGGLGVHKQMRPNSAYYVGQTVDSSVTNENLNESQYRVNPFVGISFRLDKNPFGKKTE